MGLSDKKQKSQQTQQSQTHNTYGWQTPPTTPDIDKLRGQQFEIDPGLAAQFGRQRQALESGFNQPAGAYYPKQVQQQILQSGRERLGQQEAEAMRGGQYDVNRLDGRDLAVAGMTAPTLTQTGASSTGSSQGTVKQSESPLEHDNSGRGCCRSALFIVKRILNNDAYHVHEIHGYKMALSAMSFNASFMYVSCLSASGAHSATCGRVGSVINRVLMSLWAMSFSRIFSGKSIAAQHIFAICNRFKMHGIYAMSYTAQVVRNQIAEFSDKHSVSNTMSGATLVDIPKTSITVSVQVRRPQPARDSIEDYGWINPNLFKESGEQLGVDGKSGRIVLNHLSLLYRFSGLGFRGLTHREALSF